MKNKKGFTLVELMAVVIILITVTFMALLAANKYTERGKLNSFINEANTFAKAASNKYFDDKFIDPELRDDLYHGANTGKVCYSIRDNLVNKYVLKDLEYNYHGSVELCYGTGCTYQYKLWFTDGKDFYINGETDFDNINIVEHSTDEEYFDSCGYETIGSSIGTTTSAEFAFKGSEDKITILKDGLYALEVWGAQGGHFNTVTLGGYGAYAYTEVNLKKGDILYINVGEHGSNRCNNTNDTSCKHAYNGGYKGTTSLGGGGGATTISKKSGQVFKNTNKNDFYVVAGGGAGAGSDGYGHSAKAKNAGAYCNYTDCYSHTACQSGVYAVSNPDGPTYYGAGGGIYAPISRTDGYYAAGGLSYAFNSFNKNTSIYCYECYVDTANVETQKSYSTTNKSMNPIPKYVKIGDGYAKITYLSGFTLAYDLDGGTLNDPNPKGYNAESETFTLNNPSKNGYTFTGWSDGTNLFNVFATPYKTSYYVKEDGTEVSNNSWAIYQIAVEPNTTYTLINTGEANQPGYVVYDEGGNVLLGDSYSYTKHLSFTTPSNASYIRFSLNTNTSSSGFDKAKFRIEKVNETVTITKGSIGNRSYIARYTPITYTIEYALNGGSLAEGDSNLLSYNIEYPDIVMKHPTKEGYRYTGWSGSNGTMPRLSLTIPSGSTGNRNYYANFDTYSMVTLDYNLPEMEVSQIVETGFLFDFDNDFTLDMDINIPYAQRRLLFGNYGLASSLNLEINESNNVRIYQDGNRSVSSQMTINEDSHFTFNYVASDKSFTYNYKNTTSDVSGSGTFTRSNYVSDTMRLAQDYRGSFPFHRYTVKGLIIKSNFAMSHLPENVKFPGYTFDGWYTSPTGGTKVTVSTTPTDDVTYYAHWTQNS